LLHEAKIFQKRSTLMNSCKQKGNLLITRLCAELFWKKIRRNRK
jgi:hypothetical protein